MSIIRRKYEGIASHDHGNLVDTVTNSCCKLFSEIIRLSSGDYSLMVFEGEGTTWRHEVHPLYKSNRPDTPAGVLECVDSIKRNLDKMSLKWVAIDNKEADDVIASVAYQIGSRAKNTHIMVVSGDKDMCQLINNNVTIFHPFTKSFIDSKALFAKFKVSVEQFTTYQALMGDSSDCIPGGKGIGPKTAQLLINKYGTINNMLNIAANGEINDKALILLLKSIEQVKLSYELVVLQKNIMCGLTLDELIVAPDLI